MPRNRIAKLYDSSILIFWGNIILSSIETVPIYISTNSVQGSFFPYPCQYSLFLVFSIIAILAQGDNLIMFLICIMINDVEHLFMCLLAICMSFLEKCLFTSHFLITFCVLSCLSSWFILGICKYFLPFSFVDDFLCYTETIVFVVVPLVYFCIWCEIPKITIKAYVKELYHLCFLLGILWFYVLHPSL